MKQAELFARYLDGELSDSESLVLFEELLADSKSLEEFVEMRRLHHDLRRLLNPGAGAEAFAAGVTVARSRRATDDFVRAVQKRVPVKKQTYGWAWLAAAAAVLALILGWVLTREEPKPPVVKERPAPKPAPAPVVVKPPEPIPPEPPKAPVEEPKPKEVIPPPEEPPKPILPEPPREVPKPPEKVEPPPAEPPPPLPPPAPKPEKTRVAFAKLERGKIESEGKSIEAGSDLFVGQTIVVSAGRATLLYPDSTRVKIDEQSEAVFGENGKQIELKRGRLLVDAAKQPKGQPLTLATTHADIEVQGTQFVLLHSGDSTRIDVEEGAVKFTRKSDGRSIRVSSGNFAVAPGSPFLAKPIPAVLFSENFNALGGEKPPPGWDAPERASFVVAEKMLVPEAPNRAVRIGIPWRVDREEYAVQMRFKFGEKLSRLGLQFDSTAIEIDADRGQARIALYAHDKEPQVLVQRPIALKHGAWHAWRVEVRGRKIRLLLDGGEVVSHETDLEALQLYLVGRGSAGLECDDVQILRMGP